MSGEAYEITALLMRYVFILLGALIVFRAYLWLQNSPPGSRAVYRGDPG